MDGFLQSAISPKRINQSEGLLERPRKHDPMKVNAIISALLKAAPIHQLFNLRSKLIASFEESKHAQTFSLRTVEVTRQLDREIEARLGSKPYFWVRYESSGTCGHKHFDAASALGCAGGADKSSGPVEIMRLTTDGLHRRRAGYFIRVEGREEVDLIGEHGEARDSIVETMDSGKVVADAIVVASLDLPTHTRADIAARLCHSVAAEVEKSDRMLELATKDLQAVNSQN